MGIIALPRNPWYTHTYKDMSSWPIEMRAGDFASETRICNRFTFLVEAISKKIKSYHTLLQKTRE